MKLAGLGPMNQTVDILGLIEKGKEPVSIAWPTELKGKDFNHFLVEKGILHKKADSDELEEPIGRFLIDAAITVQAFYFTDKGPFLMMFDIKTMTIKQSGEEVGVIAGLSGDSDLEQLFAVTGACARVLRCTKWSFKTLRRYIAELSAHRTDV